MHGELSFEYGLIIPNCNKRQKNNLVKLLMDCPYQPKTPSKFSKFIRDYHRENNWRSNIFFMT